MKSQQRIQNVAVAAGAVVLWLLSAVVPATYLLYVLFFGAAVFFRPMYEQVETRPDGTKVVTKWGLKDYVGLAILIGVLMTVFWALINDVPPLAVLEKLRQFWAGPTPSTEATGR
jgi:hypothetical protein